MKAPSLRARLGLVGALAIAAALALSVLGLALLFDRHVERVAVADLKARALSVAAMVEPDAPGGPGFRAGPGDPLYDQPFSGHYWQLDLGAETRRSRSLWDHALPPAGPPLASGSSRILALEGPRGEPLLAVETWLAVGRGPAAQPLRILVAMERGALQAARAGFIADLLPYSVALAGLLALAFWAQLTLGLRPLGVVSDRVVALRTGQVARIGADLPAEVLPLAGELDALLDERDQELLRARNRAGDLAHGLKTPLQALLGDAAQLRDRGAGDLAASIETIAQSMRRLVDRELARARIQSGRMSGVALPLQVARNVVDVLRRTPDGGALDWRLDIPPDLALRIDPDDLTEALGALAENAARHAAGVVRISAARQAGLGILRLRDDGPGVPEAALDSLMQRGFRADERGDGQGMGLAIVADIIEAAGGSMDIANTAPGFEVTLRLRLA